MKKLEDILIVSCLMVHDDEDYTKMVLDDLSKYTDQIYVNLNDPTPQAEKVVLEHKNVVKTIRTSNNGGRWNQGLQRDNTIRMLDEVKPEIVLFPDSVTSDTPILIERDGIIDFIEIQELMPHEDRNRLKYERCSKKISVLTKNGFKKIKWTKRHKVKKPIYHIAGEGVCRVTGDHSLFINGDMKKGSEIKKGDILDRVEFIDDNSFESITEDFAELLGFFVAEGHSSIVKRKNDKNYIQYNWNLAEQDKILLERYGEIIKAYYGHDYYLIEGKKDGYKSVYRLWINDPRKPCLDFLDLCYSKRSKKKKVPKIILNGSIKIIKAFLKGYYKGDGHFGYKSYCSDSNSFILSAGIVYLLNKLKIKYSTEIRHDKLNIIRINELISNHKKHGVRKIIVEEDFNDYVYDICTEDGTFVGGVGNVLFKNSDELYPKNLKEQLISFHKDKNALTFWFRLIYLWGDENHFRNDGLFKTIHHVRAMKWKPNITYKPYAGYACPTNLINLDKATKYHSNSPTIHYGYEKEENRIRKYGRGNSDSCDPEKRKELDKNMLILPLPEEIKPKI